MCKIRLICIPISIDLFVVAFGITTKNLLRKANTKAQGNVIKMEHARAKLYCVSKCKQLPLCKSANFEKPHCELLDDVVTDDSQLVSVNGWEYFRKYSGLSISTTDNIYMPLISPAGL